MQTIIRIPVTKKHIKLSHELYDEMQAFAELKNPEMIDVTDDAETCELYELYILLKLGYFKIYHCECSDEVSLILEITPKK